MFNFGENAKCSAVCWIQRQLTKFAYQVENFFVNVVPRWLADMWEKAKAVIDKIIEEVKKEAINVILQVVGKIGDLLPAGLRDAIPVFRYVRFSKVYMKCMLDPVACNWDRMIMPDIEVISH